MKLPNFITRPTTSQPNYIKIVNEQLKNNGWVDPNSPEYKAALEQYNKNYPNTERLDVPIGFCGYMHNKTNQFYVMPYGINNPELTMITSDECKVYHSLSRTRIPYPIDQCLGENQLPGSPGYTECTNGRRTDNVCTGANWIQANDCILCNTGTINICNLGMNCGINTSSALSNASNALIAPTELNRFRWLNINNRVLAAFPTLNPGFAKAELGYFYKVRDEIIMGAFLYYNVEDSGAMAKKDNNDNKDTTTKKTHKVGKVQWYQGGLLVWAQYNWPYTYSGNDPSEYSPSCVSATKLYPPAGADPDAYNPFDNFISI